MLLNTCAKKSEKYHILCKSPRICDGKYLSHKEYAFIFLFVLIMFLVTNFIRY